MVIKLGRVAARLLRPRLVRVEPARALMSTDLLEEKLSQYTKISPTPISIAEFI